MQLLLDTHTFIWFISGDKELHLQKVLTLDFHHRDPFDRIIIAQGLVEHLTILSKDENFIKYTNRILWK